VAVSKSFEVQGYVKRVSRRIRMLGAEQLLSNSVLLFPMSVHASNT
jgi:hypothetical protein